MITVVVPVFNEADNISTLLKEIYEVSQICPISEIVYVDDGSTDNTYNLLKSLKPSYAPLRIIKHDCKSGQSASLWTGVKAASNELVVTLDGDGQNDPTDIVALYKLYKINSATIPHLMIAGERRKRKDTLPRRIASRSANRIRSTLLRDKTKDTGCSLKLFRRKDYLSLPYFDHMHRFLPALMIRDGIKVIQTPVSHRPRLHGVSKYNNLGRALVGISDLFGVLWLQKRANAHPRVTEELD